MVATMNGMVTQLWLQADQAGELYGESTQFSGGGFAGMNFKVHAVAPDQFQQWIATAHQGGPALDPAAYIALSQPSQNVAPYTYSSVTPNLFDNIATQKLPPGPGPQANNGQSTVHPASGSR
jgi:cytochrome o ubiquinol oxidase subunit 2